MAGVTFSGRKISFGLALESTRGVANAPEIMVRWETADFEDTATTQLNASALGVLDKYSGAEIVKTWGQGQIAGKITDRAFGVLLYATFGSYSKQTHAGETVVYDHTFTQSQLNDDTTLTITRFDPNTKQQFAMAMLNSLEVDIKVGDFIRHASNFISQPSTTYVGSALTFDDENEFVARWATVKFATGPTLTGFGGATAIPVESFKLTYTKDVEAYGVIGQNNPSDIVAKDVDIKFEMVLRWTDQTYYNLRFNNTLQAVQVTIQNTGVTIGTSTNPTITFTFPQAFVTEWKPDQSIDSITKQTITGQATFSIDYQMGAKVTLTNTVPNYSSASIS